MSSEGTSDDSIRMTLGNARFHFDPERAPMMTPSLGDLEGWVRSRMRASNMDEGLAQAYRMVLGHHVRRNPFRRIANLLPFVSRRTHARIEDRCIGFVMKDIKRIHGTMAEYAVDLTRHQKTPLVETIAAIAVHEGHLDEMRDHFEATMRPDHPWLVGLRARERELDAKGILVKYHDHISESLSDEAVYNLLDGIGGRGDARRFFAAMWSARDEARSPRTRKMLDKALDEIGAGSA